MILVKESVVVVVGAILMVVLQLIAYAAYKVSKAKNVSDLEQYIVGRGLILEEGGVISFMFQSLIFVATLVIALIGKSLLPITGIKLPILAMYWLFRLAPYFYAAYSLSRTKVEDKTTRFRSECVKIKRNFSGEKVSLFVLCFSDIFELTRGQGSDKTVSTSSSIIFVSGVLILIVSVWIILGGPQALVKKIKNVLTIRQTNTA